MATKHQDPKKTPAEEKAAIEGRQNEVDSPPQIVITPPISSPSSAPAIITNEVHLEVLDSTPAPMITGLPMTSASVAFSEQVPAEIVEAERLRQIRKEVGGLLAVDELVKTSGVSRERVEELATTTNKFFIGLDEGGGKEYATIVGEQLIHYGVGPAKRHHLAHPGMHVVETSEAGGANDITREVAPETPDEVTKKLKKKEAGGSGRKRTRNDEGAEEAICTQCFRGVRIL